MHQECTTIHTSPEAKSLWLAHFRMDRENIASAILGLDGKAADPANLAARRHATQREDCGFTLKVGNLAGVDVTLEE